MQQKLSTDPWAIGVCPVQYFDKIDLSYFIKKINALKKYFQKRKNKVELWMRDAPRNSSAKLIPGKGMNHKN